MARVFTQTCCISVTINKQRCQQILELEQISPVGKKQKCIFQINVEILYKKKQKLTFNPLRIWYMRNCTWSSVSFWHFTILLRSAPIKWVTRYLPSIKDSQHIQTATNIRRHVTLVTLQNTRWAMDTFSLLTRFYQSCLQFETKFPYDCKCLH